MTRDEASEAVYGTTFSEFKARHQAEATPELLAPPLTWPGVHPEIASRPASTQNGARS